MTAGKAIGDDRLGTAGDAFYAALIAAHDELSPEDSARLNARLVLVLANLVGDAEVLVRALAAAQAALLRPPRSP
jgi:hypothetical protein